jgi:hypothetical protein
MVISRRHRPGPKIRASQSLSIAFIFRPHPSTINSEYSLSEVDVSSVQLVRTDRAVGLVRKSTVVKNRLPRSQRNTGPDFT